VSTNAFGSSKTETQRSFEDWLHAPLHEADLPDPHPLVEVRRAQLEDFDEIHRVVEAAFGVRRSPRAFDWLYRNGPLGPARTWVSVERGSRRIVSAASAIPWPTVRNREPVPGAVYVDGAVLPEFQRKGLLNHWARVRATHPWKRAMVSLEWPNYKTRGANQKHGYHTREGNRSQYEGHVYPSWYGGLPRAVLPLEPSAFLRERSVPRAARGIAAAAMGGLLTARRNLVLRGAAELRSETLSRFDSDFDEITRRCMATDDFWIEHDSPFLNWRYFDHPEQEYVAVRVAEADRIVGYGVLRLAGDAAWLMELAAPAGTSPAVLRHLIEIAREAGCARMDFFATERFPHWPLLRRTGFLMRPAEVWLGVGGPFGGSPQHLDRWQALPGDTENT
jgi:hypothetical protein